MKDAGDFTAAHDFVPRHPPSFVTRAIALARTPGWRKWALYGASGLAVAAAYLVVLYLEGIAPDQLGLIHLILPVFAFAGVPALAFFNVLAARALAAARPVLSVDDRGLDQLPYRMTTLPPRQTLVAAAGGLLGLVALTALQPADTYERLQIMVTPVATVIEWMLQVLTWSGVGVVAFEIARKLLIIDEIYRRHIRINILSPGPQYAFARLAAAMVTFTMAVIAAATLALGELATTTQWAVAAGVPAVLAAIAFVAPLWGAHRLLAAEKARNVDALGAQIAATVVLLRNRVDADDLDRVGRLRDALEGLITARSEYRAVSTWPWQRSTLGGVVTALIVPLAIWLITSWLEGGLRA